jgi:hypothetical protein
MKIISVADRNRAGHESVCPGRPSPPKRPRRADEYEFAFVGGEKKLDLINAFHHFYGVAGLELRLRC